MPTFDLGEKLGRANAYSGKLNLCMYCEFYFALDKEAQEHRRGKNHEMKSKQVQNFEITKKNIRKLKDEMRLL
ncbi:MAG: hypothetical protein ACHQ1H_05820 [Nitrososphaerales archaeon]